MKSSHFNCKFFPEMGSAFNHKGRILCEPGRRQHKHFFKDGEIITFARGKWKTTQNKEETYPIKGPALYIRGIRFHWATQNPEKFSLIRQFKDKSGHNWMRHKIKD